MKFIILDTETNGLSDFHEITEISTLDCQTMQQITWLIKIKHPEKSSPQALFITKKTAEELSSRGRYVEEVLPEVTEFLLSGVSDSDEVVLIAHNAIFDRRMMENAYKNCKMQFPVKYWLCTKEMSKAYTKKILGLQKTSHALNDLLVTANIKNTEVDNIHSSDVDVRNTFRLWKRMVTAGISNTEFIKMSPTYLKANPIIKKSKKKKQEYTLDDVMEENIDSNDSIEENDY